MSPALSTGVLLGVLVWVGVSAVSVWKESKFVKILEGLDHVGSLDTHNSLPRMHFLKFPPVNYHKTPQTSRVPSLFLFLYVTNIKLVLFLSNYIDPVTLPLKDA